MKKSFTWLFSLVVLLGSFALHVSAAGADGGIVADEVWPIDGESKAFTKTTDKIMIIFPEGVEASTGSIRITEGTPSGALVSVVKATSSLVSYSGDTVMVDLSTYLKELTTYNVCVDADAFKSVADGTASQAIGYCSSPTSVAEKSATLETGWMFTTGDYTAPTLETVYPEDGEVVGDNTISLVLTFDDESMGYELGTDGIQAGAGNITIYKADGNVWDLVTLNFGDNATLVDGELTVDGIRQLDDLVDYQVTIDAGIVKDAGFTADGTANEFAGSLDRTAWTFSTEDFTAPTFTVEADNVTNNSFDVLVETNEDGTAYGVVVEDGVGTPPADAAAIRSGADDDVEVTGGVVATLSFDALDEESEYTAYIIVDNGDVPGTEIKEVQVTTGETFDPVLQEVTYVSDGSSYPEMVTGNVVETDDGPVPLSIEMVVLEFDENIVLGAGNIIIKRVSDNTEFAAIASTDMSVETDTDVTDRTWLEVPVSGLENGVEYYVTIPGTLVFDEYGNNYNGISSNTGWRFTASDDVAPTYTVTPANLTTDVGGDAVVVITFDELVNVVSGDFLLYGPGDDIDDSDPGYNFSFDQDNNDGKFTVVTLTPDTGDDPALPSGEMVRVIVKENQIHDYNYNAISDNEYNSTVFFVEDYDGPVIDDWSGDTKIMTDIKWLESADDAIDIEYNEGIYLLGGTEITADNLYTIITVKKGTSTGANVAVDYAISDDKKVITITPATAWVSGETYYVSVSSDVEDAAGNAFEGTVASRSQVYEVKDLIAETVEINVAGDEIATSDPVTIKFDNDDGGESREMVFYQSWQSYSISLMDEIIILKEGDANGPDVPFTVTTADAITFDIDAALEGNKTYYIAVGPSTMDQAGNINVPNSATFTTLFEGAPALTGATPGDGDTEVAKDADVVLEFNTDIEIIEGDYTASTGITVSVDGGAATKVPYADLDIDGSTLTIDPADFGENVVVEISVPGDIILNVNDATGALYYAGATWSFETVDTEFVWIAKNTDDYMPTPGVPIDEALVMTFGEDVVIGTGNIDIKDAVSDAIVERIDVTSDQVSVDGDEVTITPSADFEYATAYYVEVDAGAFEDAVGNENDAIFGTDWTFGTADPQLEITNVTPVDGTDKVSLTSSIVVEFNRQIAWGSTGSIGYIEDDMAGGTSPQVYPIGSNNLSISGNVLTITHTDKDFPEDAEIWLAIDATAITVAGDASNMLPADIDNTTAPDASSFFTGDENPPIPTFDPADFDDEEAYVDVDANITISFDEDIFHKADGTVFTSGDITDDGIFELYLADGSGMPMGSAIDFVGSIAGNTVTMNPDADLDEYTMYVVVINNGTDGVVDILDHEVPTTYSQFMTTDLTAPTVSVDLTGDAEMISMEVTVDDVTADKFYYMVREKSADAAPTAAEIMAAEDEDVEDGVTEVIDLEGLAASTTYQVFYVAVDDFDNVSDVAVKEATTDDTVAPMLVSSDPATGDVDVDIDGGNIEIELTFDEDVVAGTGTNDIVVRETNTQTILGVYSSGADLSAGSDDNILILTLGGVPNGEDVMEMYVEMAAGSVMDIADTPNAFEGIFGDNAIFFSTEDNEAPEFGLDDDEISTNQNIVVKFSEDVQAGTGRAILYYDYIAVANAVEVFEAGDVTFDGDMVTIDPQEDLENGADYYLVLEDNFALDMSSNENGNSEDDLWLEVDENVAPFVEDIDDPVGDYAEGVYPTPISKDDMGTFEFDLSESLYYEVDGILTSTLLLTEATVKDNNLISIVDMDGNPIDFTFDHDGDYEVRFYVDTDDLEHNNAYTVTIQGWMDSDGLVMSPYEITFETTDGVYPTAIFDPADGEVDVDANGVFTITFNEQIYHWVNDGDPFFYEPFDNDNIDDVVYFEDGGGSLPFDATFDGVSVITVTPDEPLESGKTYYLGYDYWNIVDADDQEASDDNWAEFTVADSELPSFDIADVAPAKGETGVAADADMYVMFSENIRLSTGSIVIRNQNGTFAETVGAEGLTIDKMDSSIVWITHTDFAPDAEYFVELQEGVVVDHAGNPNAGYVDPENGWVFTTKDTYEITAEVSPLGDNQPEIVDLELTFNKDVMLNTTGDFGYYLAVYKEDGTAVVQVDASSLVVLNNVVTYFNLQLEPNQVYYARIEPKAFEDESGNMFAGIMDDSWTFSTRDNIAPQLVSTDPADDATLVDPTTSFTMTFDRDVAIGAGSIEVRYFADGELAESVDVATATVDAATMTFNLANALDANTAYYVLVPEGAVTNTEATLDPYAGINNTYSWNFSTSDIVAPKLTEWTPIDTIADNHPTFVMTFAADVMFAADGNLYVTEKDSAEATLTIPITADMVSGNMVTVDYDWEVVGSLDTSTTYVVTVDAGVLENAEGIAFGGVSGMTWTFMTGPDVATSVVPPVEVVDFKVYPNPFSNRIMIDNNDKLTRVVVLNIAGQKVIDREYPEHSISTSTLVSGVYVISMFTEDGLVKTERMVKKR